MNVEAPVKRDIYNLNLIGEKASNEGYYAIESGNAKMLFITDGDDIMIASRHYKLGIKVDEMERFANELLEVYKDIVRMRGQIRCNFQRTQKASKQ